LQTRFSANQIPILRAFRFNTSPRPLACEHFDIIRTTDPAMDVRYPEALLFDPAFTAKYRTEVASVTDESDMFLGGNPFKIDVADGWKNSSTRNGESIDALKQKLADWSVIAAQSIDGAHERLGIFISFDSPKLLRNTEWRMVFEQEISRVRHAAAGILQNRVKSKSENSNPN